MKVLTSTYVAELSQSPSFIQRSSSRNSSSLPSAGVAVSIYTGNLVVRFGRKAPGPSGKVLSGCVVFLFVHFLTSIDELLAGELARNCNPALGNRTTNPICSQNRHRSPEPAHYGRHIHEIRAISHHGGGEVEGHEAGNGGPTVGACLGPRYRLHVRSLPGSPDLVFPAAERSSSFMDASGIVTVARTAARCPQARHPIGRRNSSETGCGTQKIAGFCENSDGPCLSCGNARQRRTRYHNSRTRYSNSSDRPIADPSEMSGEPRQAALTLPTPATCPPARG